MTPWEPAKIPFLIGFAAILAVLYKNLARTYWGVPRAKDVLPLVVMAILPFVPFFVLKDFGQMMVFSSVYATLYLVAVRRFSQRFVLVGSVMLVLVGIDRWGIAGQHSGKDPAASDNCRAGQESTSESDPAAISSVAGRFRSANSRYLLVEKGLRRLLQKVSSPQRPEVCRRCSRTTRRTCKRR